MKNLSENAKNLFKNSTNNLTLLSNASAFLMAEFDHLNWVGFYLFDNDESLILGPFQGNVACEVIKVGSGVCGTAFKENKILNVSDVNNFKGHIVCDHKSKSEVVFPLVKDNYKIGVLDIDSYLFSRFDDAFINEINIVIEELLKEYQIK